MNVLQEVITRQRKEHLSNRKFAKKLGISHQMWDFISSGKREIGYKVMWAIWQQYPDLLDPILDLVDSKVLKQGAQHDINKTKTHL